MNMLKNIDNKFKQINAVINILNKKVSAIADQIITGAYYNYSLFYSDVRASRGFSAKIFHARSLRSTPIDTNNFTLVRSGVKPCYLPVFSIKMPNYFIPFEDNISEKETV